MARTLPEIIAALESYVPSDDLLPLNDLTQELLETGLPEKAIPVLFSIMERYPGEDLGSPGPLVHTLEKCEGFESYLIESVNRQPTFYNVWMVNRILNSDISLSHRESLLTLLASVLTNPKADEGAKQSALDFLEWQSQGGDA
jgi:hypothetical protein